MIRVFVCDDSLFFQRALEKIFKADGGIEIAGSARNGRDALATWKETRPDLILLDLEMPACDGIRFLEESRSAARPPVVVLSATAAQGSVRALQALELGAVAHLDKPSLHQDGGITQFAERLRTTLHNLIRDRRAGLTVRPPTARPPGPGVSRLALGGTPRLVAIGTSAGGPVMLRKFLGRLRELRPDETPGIPVVVALHMPETFTEVFARNLSEQTGFPIGEAAIGSAVEPRIFILPGGRDTILVPSGGRVFFRESPGGPEGHTPFHPSVDALFTSASVVFGPGVLGIVLSGMGTDGLRGSRRIAEQGGCVMAQNAETSLVFGMPRAVIETGLAASVGSPEELAERTAEAMRSPSVEKKEAS